jgi:hypothetical protein
MGTEAIIEEAFIRFIDVFCDLVYGGGLIDMELVFQLLIKRGYPGIHGGTTTVYTEEESAEDHTPVIHLGNGMLAEGEIDEETNNKHTRYLSLPHRPSAPPDSGDKTLLLFSVPTFLLSTMQRSSVSILCLCLLS